MGLDCLSLGPVPHQLQRDLKASAARAQGSLESLRGDLSISSLKSVTQTGLCDEARLSALSNLTQGETVGQTTTLCRRTLGSSFVTSQRPRKPILCITTIESYGHVTGWPPMAAAGRAILILPSAGIRSPEGFPAQEGPMDDAG